MKNFRRTRRSGTQEGYYLLSILLAVMFMSLAMMAVAPAVVQQVKRDREEEMIHRGVQYARAIKKYVRKFGRYPVRLEDLENTNNVRFLRQRYKDPLTGKDFHLIHYGEVQLGGQRPTVGQPAGPAGQGPGFGTSGQQGSQSAFSGPAFSGASMGGGPIIGVSSTSEQESIRVFSNKNHYNQWQFIYDPTIDRGNLITGPYQPLQQLMPGAQIPGMTPAGPPPGGTPGATPPPKPQ